MSDFFSPAADPFELLVPFDPHPVNAKIIAKTKTALKSFFIFI